MAAQPEHEALVAQFFARCEQSDPDLYREVCERHTVLTDRQVRYRDSKEIPFSCIARGVDWRLLNAIIDLVNDEEDV